MSRRGKRHSEHSPANDVNAAKRYSSRPVLIPEPANPHDPNAVRVHIHAGALVGYLSRDDALAYQPVTQVLVAQHAAGICRAKLIGGTPNKPSIGVTLNLASPEEILPVIRQDEQPL